MNRSSEAEFTQHRNGTTEDDQCREKEDSIRDITAIISESAEEKDSLSIHNNHFLNAFGCHRQRLSSARNIGTEYCRLDTEKRTPPVEEQLENEIRELARLALSQNLREAAADEDSDIASTRDRSSADSCGALETERRADATMLLADSQVRLRNLKNRLESDGARSVFIAGDVGRKQGRPLNVRSAFDELVTDSKENESLILAGASMPPKQSERQIARAGAALAGQAGRQAYPRAALTGDALLAATDVVARESRGCLAAGERLASVTSLKRDIMRQLDAEREAVESERAEPDRRGISERLHSARSRAVAELERIECAALRDARLRERDGQRRMFDELREDARRMVAEERRATEAAAVLPHKGVLRWSRSDCERVALCGCEAQALARRRIVSGRTAREEQPLRDASERGGNEVGQLGCCSNEANRRCRQQQLLLLLRDRLLAVGKARLGAKPGHWLDGDVAEEISGDSVRRPPVHAAAASAKRRASSLETTDRGALRSPLARLQAAASGSERSRILLAVTGRRSGKEQTSASSEQSGLRPRKLYPNREKYDAGTPPSINNQTRNSSVSSAVEHAKRFVRKAVDVIATAEGAKPVAGKMLRPTTRDAADPRRSLLEPPVYALARQAHAFKNPTEEPDVISQVSATSSSAEISSRYERPSSMLLASAYGSTSRLRKIGAQLRRSPLLRVGMSTCESTSTSDAASSPPSAASSLIAKINTSWEADAKKNAIKPVREPAEPAFSSKNNGYLLLSERQSAKSGCWNQRAAAVLRPANEESSERLASNLVTRRGADETGEAVKQAAVLFDLSHPAAVLPPKGTVPRIVLDSQGHLAVQLMHRYA